MGSVSFQERWLSNEGSFPQDDRTVFKGNIHSVKQCNIFVINLVRNRGIDKSIIISGDFSHFFFQLVLDLSRQKKITKDKEVLNNTNNELDLMEVDRFCI